MEESVTYQEILEQGYAKGWMRGIVEGRIEGGREVLLRVGSRQLGPLSAEAEARIAAIDSPEQVVGLLDKLLVVESWSELLSD